jgi:serine/threonine protein kinase
MPLEPGSRLGHYELLGLLGAGGMGEVYRAHDPKPSRDVAIKVLLGGSNDISYDIAPDGQRFLMMKKPQVRTINVVLNWFDELKAKMGEVEE